ncbi:MAG: ABC transporter ATP-binding protein [Pseudomonadota bacterium]
MNNPLLEVRDLTVEFANTDAPAVDQVSFTLSAGETIGIVGESGSGKSVSCLSILGLLPHGSRATVTGTVRLDGENIFDLPKKAIRRLRGEQISMIFQDPMSSLNPYHRIGRQIIEPAVVRGVSENEAKQAALQLLIDTGVAHDPADAEIRYRQYPHEFSGGMRQRVMISIALITNPRILIADEPTTALDATTQRQVLSIIKNLQADRNVALLFISHDLNVVRQVADRVLVMKSGKVVEQGRCEEVLESPRHPYSKQLIDSVPRETKKESSRMEFEIENDLIKLTQVGVDFRVGKRLHTAVDSVDLAIRYGEVLGLVGESGSGKSTIAMAINRLCRLSRGEIHLDGESIQKIPDERLKQFRKHVQLVFQDPYSSLNPRMNAYETIAEPLRVHRLVHDEREELSRVVELAEQVEIDPRDLKKYPHAFSGGQRQRIAIARAIAVNPRLLVADECVSALDVTIQKQVMDLLLQLTRSLDMAMLFISHDLAVIRYMSDRVAVMKDGAIVELNDTRSLFKAPQNEHTKELIQSMI